MGEPAVFVFLPEMLLLLWMLLLNGLLSSMLDEGVEGIVELEAPPSSPPYVSIDDPESDSEVRSGEKLVADEEEKE